MKKAKENKLKESKSLNLNKDDQQFPASQFNKDQRKDAEKAMKGNDDIASQNDSKEAVDRDIESKKEPRK